MGFIGTTDNGWFRAATGDAAFLNNTTHNAEKCLAVSRANDNRGYPNTADRYNENGEIVISVK